MADDGEFPLTRQLSSVYSLTLQEFQSTLGAPQKDFGSMNMDELLRSIWTAEEASTLAGDPAPSTAAAASSNLHRQGSLTLPRTLSQKTVDQVLRDFQNPNPSNGSEELQQQCHLPTHNEMTLEEFLVRAGVVREDANINNNNSKSGNNNYSNNNMSFNLGFSQAGGAVQTQIHDSSGANLGNRGNNRIVQAQIGNSTNLGGRGYMEIGNQKGAYNSGLMMGVESPNGKGNGDLSSLSPVGYVIGGGGRGRGRKSSGVVEKVVERRQKRMIKNRESAARSRARKQAYTMELEDEVAKLKEQNQDLEKKQADIMEMQKNQVMEKIKQQRGSKKPCLRRTQTGPW